MNKYLDLYLKYDNEEDFVTEFARTIPDRIIKNDKNIDAEQYLSEYISDEINKRILGSLVWLLRDKVLLKYYRTKKLERVCK